MKVGYQGTLLTDDRTWSTNNQNLTYRFNNGVPNQLTQSISPWVNNSRAGWHALYVQEQWTLGRLTLQGALRFDRASSWFPEQTGGTDAVPADGDRVPGDEGRRQLQGHHAADGRGLRRVRQRQDGAQGQLGQVPRGRRASQRNYVNTNPTLRMPDTTGLRTAGRHADVDRRQRRISCPTAIC